MKNSIIILIFFIIFNLILNSDDLVVKREYYISGKVKREILFDKETKKSKLKLYYETGEILAIYSIKNGEFNGIQKTFFKNGKLRSKSIMKNNHLNGEYNSFYMSGKQKSISTYKTGLLIGFAKDFYESGRLRTDWVHKKGLSSGKNYYETGELKFEIKFNDLQLIFLRGFQKSSKPLNGKISLYYESGKINTKGNFINGFPHGKMISYFESGGISEISNFNRGKPIGEFKSFDESEKLYLKIPYKNAVIHGIVELYNIESPDTVNKILYKNGKKIKEYIEKTEK